MQQTGRGEQDGFRWGLPVFFVVRNLESWVLPAVPEALAVTVHFRDVDMVGEAVQQRSGEQFLLTVNVRGASPKRGLWWVFRLLEAR